jgi:hypothetical protein
MSAAISPDALPSVRRSVLPRLPDSGEQAHILADPARLAALAATGLLAAPPTAALDRLTRLVAVAAQAGGAVRRKLAEDALTQERTFLASVLDSLSD